MMSYWYQYLQVGQAWNQFIIHKVKKNINTDLHRSKEFL